MTKNPNSVPRKQWKKWCDLARRVFNDTYLTIALNKEIMQHPKARKMSLEHWGTVAWNAAWTAADACQTGLEQISEGK